MQWCINGLKIEVDIFTYDDYPELDIHDAEGDGKLRPLISLLSYLKDLATIVPTLRFCIFFDDGTEDRNHVRWKHILEKRYRTRIFQPHEFFASDLTFSPNYRIKIVIN